MNRGAVNGAQMAVVIDTLNNDPRSKGESADKASLRHPEKAHRPDQRDRAQARLDPREGARLAPICRDPRAS